MHHILTLNSFTFNNKHFLQIKGCAMGTVAAPSYAIIFMGKFEETYIYPDINEDCLFYVRYIDDILFIYTGTETKLDNFFCSLNLRHDSIKFDYIKSTTSIAFLDTLIYIDENRQLQTTLYVKPTDTHNYLHARSTHPTHLKNNLPYSQALRIRRICSETTELNKHNNKLAAQFSARGYSETLIKKQIDRAVTTPREDTLQLTHKQKTNRIPLITTFHDSLPPLSRIIQNRWDILTLKPEFKEIFKEPGLLAYRRPENIKDIISSNTIINDKVYHSKSSPKIIKSCLPCNSKKCLCCNHLRPTNSFTSTTNNRTFNIYHNSDCKSSKVIYLLECTRCNIQYVGKSEWPLHIRVNNYRHRIRSTNPSNLIPIEEHFRLPNHSFKDDAKFTIIERLESATLDATCILERHENMWISLLQTLSPYGLNRKLNSLNQN